MMVINKYQYINQLLNIGGFIHPVDFISALSRKKKKLFSGWHHLARKNPSAPWCWNVNPNICPTKIIQLCRLFHTAYYGYENRRILQFRSSPARIFLGKKNQAKNLAMLRILAETGAEMSATLTLARGRRYCQHSFPATMSQRSCLSAMNRALTCVRKSHEMRGVQTFQPCRWLLHGQVYPSAVMYTSNLLLCKCWQIL